MNILIEIFATIALLAFVILTIYAMISLKNLVALMNDSRNSLIQITSDMNQLKDKLIISLDSVNSATKQIESTVTHLESHADTILGAFDPFIKLTDIVYDKIAPPVTTVATIVSAASKAVSAFVNVLSKK
ncbi:MAG: hypothetical protein NT007_11210 [Candidatus Kapabacteria bacterium]|nr:hypothetical protein [Candidatus Kapabacteria bacterium]